MTGTTVSPATDAASLPAPGGARREDLVLWVILPNISTSLYEKGIHIIRCYLIYFKYVTKSIIFCALLTIAVI